MIPLTPEELDMYAARSNATAIAVQAMKQAAHDRRVLLALRVWLNNYGGRAASAALAKLDELESKP